MHVKRNSINYEYFVLKKEKTRVIEMVQQSLRNLFLLQPKCHFVDWEFKVGWIGINVYDFVE